MNYKVLVAAALAAAAVQASTFEERLPDPWIKHGQSSALHACQAGVDSELVPLGERNMTLKCKTEQDGFVGVMQRFDAEAYRGTRLRYSASLKTEKLSGSGGGLWMRVDEPGRAGASFDNMGDRALKGTLGWTRHEIVLDVSTDAELIAVGMLMAGRGQLWIKDIQIETVGADVPTTGATMQLPKNPQNLQLD